MRRNATCLCGAVVGLLTAAAVGAQSYPLLSADPTGAAVELVYHTECAQCHGEMGDGQGEHDPALAPPPRDFTRGKFKLRSTDPSMPITRAELAATIAEGMEGSAMPSFRFLPARTREDLAAYVLKLAGLEAGPAAPPSAVWNPPPVTPELVAEGKKLYVELGCPSCHGVEGRGDGSSAKALRDEWGHPDPPRDLTRDPFRGGSGGRDIFLRLTFGMPGTPMAAYADVTNERQRWAVVAYLQSIRRQPPPPRDAKERGKLVVEQRACRACHRLEGRGGRIGPSLDDAARRLRLDWMRRYLVSSRPERKVHPQLPARMPQMFLESEEIDAVVLHLANLAGRTYPEKEDATVEPALAESGAALFAERCASCHAAAVPSAPALERLTAPAVIATLAAPDFAPHPRGHGAPVRALDAADARGIAAFLVSPR